MDEKLQQITRMLKSVSAGYIVKEFDVRINEKEIYIALRGVDKNAAPEPKKDPLS